MTTVDNGAPQARTAPPVPAFARGPVLAITAVVAATHLAAATGSGYRFDEVYVLAIGRNHLDWGSADQPPLAPLLAALADAIAPGSNAVLRLPAVLATAGAVVVAALVARELGGDRRTQTITAANGWPQLRMGAVVKQRQPRLRLLPAATGDRSRCALRRDNGRRAAPVLRRGAPGRRRRPRHAGVGRLAVHQPAGTLGADLAAAPDPHGRVNQASNAA